MEELYDELHRCCYLLAQSDRALEFARDHWLPLIGGFSAVLPGSVKLVIDEQAHADIRRAGTEEWKTDFDLLTLAMGQPNPGSALEPLVKIMKESRAAIGVVTSAVNETFVLILLKRMDKLLSAQGTSTIKRVLGTVFMRFVAAGAIEHRLASEPGMSATATLEDFFEALRTAKGANADQWAKVGRDFEAEFGIAGRFKNWSAFAGLSILTGLVLMAYSLKDDDEQSTLIKLANFTAGFYSAAGGTVSLWAVKRLALKHGFTGDELGVLSKAFGALGAIAGMVAAGRAAQLDLNRGNTYGVATNTLAAMSGGLTLAGLTLSAGLVASLATPAGVVVGAVAFAMAVLGPGTGPADLVRSYWRYAKSRKGPVDDISRSLKDDLEAALEKAEFLLVDLSGTIGRRGEALEIPDPPTVHAAHALGFETPELKVMFEDGDDLLDGMGFEHPRYKGFEG